MFVTPAAHASLSLRQPYDPDSDDEADAGFGDAGSQGLDDEAEAAAAAAAAKAAALDGGLVPLKLKLTLRPCRRRGSPTAPPPTSRPRVSPTTGEAVNPSQGGRCVCRGFDRDETRPGDSVTIVCKHRNAPHHRTPRLHAQPARERSEHYC